MKKASFMVMGIAALVGFVSLMAWGMLNQEPVTGRSGIAKMGKEAPNFTLPLFAGGEFTLEEYIGDPIIINFWASWCVPCREEAPGLERTWRAYKNRGVMFVGVDIQDPEEDARAYIREFAITYPNGPDLKGEITVDYGVVGIPVTYFVDKQGIIVRRFVGALSERKLVSWIEELLAGAPLANGGEESNPEGYFELGRERDQP